MPDLPIPLTFDHSYLRDMEGAYLRLPPDTAPNPALVVFNTDLVAHLGLDPAPLLAHGAEWFSGAALPPGADPAALAYAGHQFGGFSPVLGDGRAHLLGEFADAGGRRWDLQLKGSGRTPFARGGDGKAVLGPMLREYLISEAMAALGVPTTRSLAVVTTGERVIRDNRARAGAVLARVAASHIRVGTFQFFAARGEVEALSALADHAIARHYPHIPAGPAQYLAFFDAVTAAQARLIARWMGLGFIHGVMNTDNMAVSGETIDYGPCAFMDAFAPGRVFSSIDRQGRYSWGNQPLILGWNLARLAEAMLPLLHSDEETAVDLANARLQQISGIYQAEWRAEMAEKLGLAGADPGDDALIAALLVALQGADWTIFFHKLPQAVTDDAPLRPLFTDFTAMAAWLPRWRARLAADGPERMRRKNPAVIPRNHQVEAALTAAEDGDLAPFTRLLQALRQPFVPDEAYGLPPPAGFGDYVTYCGT